MKQVISALEDIKRQIDVENWDIPVNDRGSGSAGVRYINDSNIIDDYLYFSKTGDNSSIPQCDNIDYISVSDFGEDENEIINEILDVTDFVEKDEIIGLIACYEHYDMDYVFYVVHIKG